MAVAVVALLASRRSVSNYLDPDKPKFEGNYSDGFPEFDGEIKVISWNISFSEEIDQAIQELREVEALQGAEVILLQEMDEAGTEAIAKALEYNYIYYPASIHSYHDRNFGNAVLSKWPIVDSEKIILPHRNPRNDQIRIAVRALLDVGDEKLPVYSVHTETFWLGQDSREDQISLLAEEIDPDYSTVIVGGDFNTLTPLSEKILTERMEVANLEPATDDAGATVGIGRFGLQFDHVFTRGLKTFEYGVWQESEASDHYPLWVELQVITKEPAG
jgi:endonuclease/exonuclease/phosphatase family metal-dependent hydrolase